MSKFDDAVHQDTPRMVVMFRQTGAGNEQYQWGIVGRIPILTLIGYITRVQAELFFRAPDPCDQSALVIAWDPNAHTVSYFIHPDIPVDSMVGMLETIKATLVGSSAAKQIMSRGTVLGPDGRPMQA